MSEDTFISHLMELRDRLLRSLIAIGIVFVCLFPLRVGALRSARLPDDAHAAGRLEDDRDRRHHAFPHPGEDRGDGRVPRRAAVRALPGVGVRRAGPVLARKKLVLPLVVASTVLFLLGIAFCYFFVFGVVFSFVNRIAPKSITVAPDIEQYLNFVLTMFLAFGVTFEVPIVVILLARMGIVTLEQLKNVRPISSSARSSSRRS